MTIDVDGPASGRPRIPFWIKVAAAPAVILLGTVAFLFGYLLQPTASSPREQARQACLDAVEDQLNEPVARFFDVSEVSASDIAAVAGEVPKAGGEDFFTVTGKVEQANTVGASDFLCTVERSGERWTADATVF